jgi:chromosome segregation ATPase
MFSKSERFPDLKDDIPGPNSYSVEEKRTQVPVTFSTSKRFASPIVDKKSFTMSQFEPESPLGKFHTPQKSRMEIAGLKVEVDDLRQQLREESVRKKAVLKDIELQTRQLQASEARMRVMETKLKELAQSKQALATEKAASDKELLQLRAKWDSAARKLDKIHETVTRAQAKIATAEKDRSVAEQRVAALMAELSKRQAAETRCIELTEQAALSARQVEQLQQDLKTMQDTFTSQAERTTEETQGQVYSLACTISQLRADLDAEMNYSTARKTELALLHVEKAQIETALREALVKHEATLTACQEERDGLVHKVSQTQAQLDALTNEYDQFRAVRDSRLVLLNDEISTLQEESAQKDAALIEKEQEQRELEAAYEALVNDRESGLREIEMLKDDIKSRQVENRRLDERVHFLESAMDYLRGEMAAQKDELDELKQISSLLHERLAQSGTDLQSAQASQKQLAESLQVANEKIEQLEAALAQAKLEAEIQGSELESAAAARQTLQSQLETARNDAEDAQRTAKEDLEAMHIELEAESAKLANCREKLAEKEATHDALVSAHEALKKAHETVQQEMEERFHQLKTSREAEHELLGQNNDLAVEKSNLEAQLEGLARELSLSQQSVAEHQQSADLLAQEIDQLKLAAMEGEQKMAALEAQLQASSNAVVALTSANESLAANVNDLEGNVASLNTEVEALAASQATLQKSLVEAQVEKELLVKQTESELQTLKESSEGAIATLKSELNVALESALDLMTSKTELAEQHSNSCARVAALEILAEESERQCARQMESQRGYVNQISELRGEIRELTDQLALNQQDHEKQLRIVEECYGGKLQTMEADFRRQLAEMEQSKAEVAQAAREQLDMEQAAHYKQMDSLHQSILELKRELEASADAHATQTAEIESLKAIESDLRASESQMRETLESVRDEATTVAQASTEALARVQEEAAEASKRSAAEWSAKEAEREAQAAKVAEMEGHLSGLRSRLSEMDDLVSELQVEKRAAESALTTLRDELEQYKTQLSETDAAVVELENVKQKLDLELSNTKKTLESEQQTWSAERKRLEGEKRQWVALAESQKSELEESFSLMRAAQDEVDAVRGQYEALKSRREEEERELADARVKKLGHEVRMLTAELTRQKGRVQTREAAIAAGKAREEKLQTNLDAQIDKCRDLQRQLADKDREAIIERGRARSTSKPTPVAAPSATAAAAQKEKEEGVSVDDFNDVNVQLALARTEIARLQKQLEVEKSQIENLIAEQTKLTGHNNPKQKIQLTHRLMTENHELKLERASLLSQLEKKGHESPLRKSVTKIVKPRTALTVLSATTSAVGTPTTGTPSTPTVDASSSKLGQSVILENAENVPSVQQ